MLRLSQSAVRCRGLRLLEIAVSQAAAVSPCVFRGGGLPRSFSSSLASAPRCVIVTGGANGLGRGVVDAFLYNGGCLQREAEMGGGGREEESEERERSLRRPTQKE